MTRAAARRGSGNTTDSSSARAAIRATTGVCAAASRAAAKDKVQQVLRGYLTRQAREDLGARGGELRDGLVQVGRGEQLNEGTVGVLSSRDTIVEPGMPR